MKTQYRTRRITPGLLLAPTAGQMLIAGRDGHHYLIDGPRTELVTRIHPPLPKPMGMGMRHGRPETTGHRARHPVGEGRAMAQDRDPRRRLPPHHALTAGTHSHGA